MENKDNSRVWKIICLVLVCLLAVVGVMYVQKTNNNDNNNNETPSEQVEVEYLSSWNDDAKAKQELIAYMEAITDENNADYIPVENRIAVFDMDGTVCCETDPGYFDHMLFMHRVNDDPTYTPTDVDLATAEKVQSYFDTGKYPSGLDIEHGQGIASTFKGFTLEEFDAYIKEYKNTPMNSYENMTLGEAFYVPMLEVIDYLQANDFKVYIVSGTDRLIVRSYIDGVIDIPNSQIIGSDETIIARDQGDIDGLEYVFDEDDELVLGGTFVTKNLKMNKVTVIQQEIGEQPVLSFGNSSGDASMAEYATSNNKYRSLAFMNCCDDLVRENGNEASAEKMYGLCEQFGWIPVSMKNDWKTIYKEGVTKK